MVTVFDPVESGTVALQLVVPVALPVAPPSTARYLRHSDIVGGRSRDRQAGFTGLPRRFRRGRGDGHFGRLGIRGWRCGVVPAGPENEEDSEKGE